MTPAACWSLDQHLRPSFEQLLAKLQDISRSPFMSFPRESFYSMQQTWKTEIDEDIGHREKVRHRGVNGSWDLSSCIVSTKTIANS